MGITMSTPCDGVNECIDNLDENNCEFPIWLLPSTLLTSVVILLFICIFFIMNDIKKTMNGIKLILEGQKSTEIDLSKRSIRHMRIAYFTEIEDYDEIRHLFFKEIEYHGSEGSAICCLKV